MADSELMGVGSPARFREAYEAVLPEMLALPPERIVTMNIDVLEAVTTVMGSLPEIRALRPQIETLPKADLKAFDRLETYALALVHANALFAAASAPAQSLPALAEAGVKLRDRLASDATALGKRGLLDSTLLDQLKGAVGYKNLAHDLLTLAAMLRGAWDRIQSKTPVTLGELDEAEQLADRLLWGIGERAQSPERIAEQKDRRQRAFTLFYRTYDDVRRSVEYLRWNEEDGGKIAPSLYEGRGGRGKPKDVVPNPDQTSGSATDVNAASSDATEDGARGRSGRGTTGGPERLGGGTSVGLPDSAPYES